MIAQYIMRATAGIALGVLITGCTPEIPRVRGEPVAAPVPNHLWRPPPGVQVNDSLRAPPLPADLAARASSLTLSDIVDIALRNNPATRESWAQARASAAAYGIARASYFPTLDASVIATQAEQPTSGFSAIAGQRSIVTPSVSLSYTVLDFGVRRGNVTSARETAYAMSFTHNAMVESTVLAVEQAYYTYVAARGVLESRQQSLHEAQVSYEAACTRDSVGVATQADVLQARTALAQAQLALDTAEAHVQTTRTGLAVALGVPPTLPYDVSGRMEDVNVVAVTQSVDSLIDEALSRRPDLQAVHANVLAARADVRAARGALLPSLTLSATSGYANANLAPLTGRSYNLSLGVSVPLFHGLANSYDVARAKADVQFEAARAEALRQSVAADVVTAYYQVEAAVEQVHTTDELFASATAGMDVARGRYRAGVGSILDLLTAQAALASARAERARARWAWAQQLAGLAYAAGALDEHGGSTLPVTAPRAPR